MSHRRKGEDGRKLKGWGWSCGKPETDGEDTHKVDMFHGAGGEEEQRDTVCSVPSELPYPAYSRWT